MGLIKETIHGCYDASFDTMDVFIFQEVVPVTAVQAVKELFVPPARVAAVKAEAEALPSLDITKVKAILFNSAFVHIGRFGHKMAILPLLLIQEEQLSVNGKRMCTKHCKLPQEGLPRLRIIDHTNMA